MTKIDSIHWCWTNQNWLSNAMQHNNLFKNAIFFIENQSSPWQTWKRNIKNWFLSNGNRHWFWIENLKSTSAFSTLFRQHCIVRCIMNQFLSNSSNTMTLSNLLAPNITNTRAFHNLALFICHLFIDGSFRTGHILHHPNLFDSQLISEIQLNCPISIPWQVNDVTHPISLPWKTNETTDHVLQLVFFDPDNLPKNIDKLVNLFVYYRVFGLSATDEPKVQNQIESINKVNVKSSFNSLIVHQSVDDGSVCVHSVIPSSKVSEKSVEENVMKSAVDVVPRFHQNELSDFKNQNVFDLTFGKNEHNWLMIINHYDFNLPINSKQRFRNMPQTLFFSVNFFKSSLNTNLFNITTQLDNSIFHHQIARQRARKTYKELSTVYDPLDTKELWDLKNLGNECCSFMKLSFFHK